MNDEVEKHWLSCARISGLMMITFSLVLKTTTNVSAKSRRDFTLPADSRVSRDSSGRISELLSALA
jgi:hypothetical protein